MSQATATSVVNSNCPVFILIDGHSLAFRSYYAFAKSKKGALRTSTGIPTSICFGFLNSLLQVIESEQPEYLAIAFDLGEPTFRSVADPTYKANRQETPEDFVPDLKNLQKLLAALNVTIAVSPGYEADDVLGTLAHQASLAGYRVKIVTGDRDLFQLVNDQEQISVLYLEPKLTYSGSGSYREFDTAAVVEKLSITPQQVIDYKALCGDKSDNIPGITGIGDKTAIKLLNEYSTLEGIYQSLNQLKGAVKQKIATGKDNAFHSRYLATIDTKTPLKITLEECLLKGFDYQEVIPLLKELELKKIIDRIEHLQEKLGGKLKLQSETVASEREQLSLFNSDESGFSLNQEIIQQNNKFKSVNNPDSPSLVQPQIITTAEQLEQLINTLKKYTNPSEPVAWDTETTALEPHHATLVGIGCCWGNQTTDIAYIPVGHKDGKQLDCQQVLTALKPILESLDYPKAFQNTKFDRLVLHYQGIKLAGVVFDPMLASYVINPETSHNLTDLSERYLIGIVSKTYKNLGIPKGQTIADLSIDTVAEYCGLDAYATYLLVEKLQAELIKFTELHKLLIEVEQPLEIVLADMEKIGFKINVPYLQQFSLQLAQNLQELEQKAYQAAGEIFNLNSPKQLSEILFEKLGLNRKKSSKTKTGYSTNQAVLEKLQGDHPLIDYILEQRTLSKLKSTYVDALPALVRSDTQRVHTDFNQTNTATGRLSSSNPNLQNIPIRTEFSRQIRQAFIPENDWLLVAADYSQIELRILAHLSQEPVLVEAYRSNQDVHSITAQLLFDKSQVTAEERRLGKIINFGVIYGMGAQRFARESGFSTAVGKEFIDKYRAKYTKVFAYLEGVKKEAIANGFVTTILGRRRYFNFGSKSLTNLQGSQPQDINLAELKYNYNDAQLLRAAANSPIQGSSADIIKIAMVKLHQILQQYQARLLLQIHDELVFEVPPHEWQELQTQIKITMENAVSLSVPLLVEINAGKNWMEAK
ncbi:DNA polymerase I [Stanieria cyanosphaera PCC 7437]|uniref:DNA polymerase I n=1 Tax=Stanieria cyanosphaera (strain ATCC 29371 / PCC 7437) TaxID=111780 RepID=K9XQH6_STAC7|nr:DNA polymerase I [Stanieria cyanosphaera]AFZ33917.1 DNA polymerase I [Stanieria cyanosphaera PCC 7437]